MAVELGTGPRPFGNHVYLPVQVVNINLNGGQETTNLALTCNHYRGRPKYGFYQR